MQSSDWTEAYDNEGNLYFYNNVTGEQSWTPPSSSSEAIQKPKRFRGGRTEKVQIAKKKGKGDGLQETYTKSEFKREMRKMEGKITEAKSKTSLALKERNALRKALQFVVEETESRLRRENESKESLKMFFEEAMQRKDYSLLEMEYMYEGKEKELIHKVHELDSHKEMHLKAVATFENDIQNLHETFAHGREMIVTLQEDNKELKRQLSKQSKERKKLQNTKDTKIEEVTKELRRMKGHHQILKDRHDRTLRTLVALWLAESGGNGMARLPPFLVQYAPRTGIGSSAIIERENHEASVIQHMCRSWLSYRKIEKLRIVIQQKKREERDRERYVKWESPLVLGRGIMGNYGGEGEFYPATIRCVYVESNTYDIVYNDGDVEEGIERHHIYPLEIYEKGTRIEALYGGEGDEWFPGTIETFYPKDFKYDISYDDGDKENAIKMAFVRKLVHEETNSSRDRETNDEFGSDTVVKSAEDEEDEEESNIEISDSEEGSDADEAEEEKMLRKKQRKRRKENERREIAMIPTDDALGLTHGVPDSTFAKELVLAMEADKTLVTKAFADARVELDQCKSLIKRGSVQKLKETEMEIKEAKITLQETMELKEHILFTIRQKETELKQKYEKKEENEENFVFEELDSQAMKRRRGKLKSAETKISKLREKILYLQNKLKKETFIPPDEIVWAKIVGKNLSVFQRLQIHLNSARNNFLHHHKKYIGVEIEGHVHQLKTQKNEELELLEYDTFSVEDKKVKEDEEEKGETDFGAEIFPEKEAYEITEKKMKSSAPHLDVSVLNEPDKLVSNPEYIPDEMLDPEDDPNDPNRPSEYIPAYDHPDYKIFFTLHKRTLKDRKKAKIDRDNAIEVWKKRKEQQALDEARIKAKREAEAMYQKQRVTLSHWVSESIIRSLRAEKRSSSASVHQSAHVQRQIVSLSSEMEKARKMHQHFEQEMMELEEKRSQIFARLDHLDNALHFTAVQQEAGGKLEEVKVAERSICKELEKVFDRKRNLVTHFEALQKAERLRLASEVKGYEILKSSVLKVMEQFRRSDSLWLYAEKANPVIHIKRINRLKEKLRELQRLDNLAQEGVKRLNSEMPIEPKPPSLPCKSKEYDADIDTNINGMRENSKNISSKYKEEMKVYQKLLKEYKKKFIQINKKLSAAKATLAETTFALQKCRVDLKKAELKFTKLERSAELSIRREAAEKEMAKTREDLLLCHNIGVYRDAKSLSEHQMSGYISDTLHQFLLRCGVDDASVFWRLEVKRLRKSLDQIKEKTESSKWEREMELITQKGKMRKIEAEMNAMRLAKKDAMTFMRDYIVKKQEVMEEERRKMSSTIKKMAEDFSKKEQSLQKTIQESREEVVNKTRWIKAMKEDMRRYRQDTDYKIKKADLKARKQAQLHSDTMQKVALTTEKVENRSVWIFALENKIKVLTKKISELEEKQVIDRETFLETKSALERESWRRDETARVILSDIDMLFLFFCEAIDKMAGRSQLTNDKLRENCTVDVLLALCKSKKAKIVQMAVSKL
eukprot:g2001.t1